MSASVQHNHSPIVTGRLNGIPDLDPGHSMNAGSSQRRQSTTVFARGAIIEGSSSSPIFPNETQVSEEHRFYMTKQQVSLSTRLKGLGFTPGNQMKLYGLQFEVLSEPIVMGDDLVFVDVEETGSGRPRRVRIPLPITNMARETAA